MRNKSRYILKLTKSLFKCRNFTYQEPKAKKHTLNHHSQPPQVTPHPGKTELETASGASLPTSLHWFSGQTETSGDPASFFPALFRFEGDGEDIFYISTIRANAGEALKALMCHKVKPDFPCRGTEVVFCWERCSCTFTRPHYTRNKKLHP